MTPVSCITVLGLLMCNAAALLDVYKLKGKPDGGYYLQLDIGTPPSSFDVLIDTGSSNFALAAYAAPNISKYFHPTDSSTYHSMSYSIEVNYTQGHWKGVLGTDIVQFSGGNISRRVVSVALIKQSQNFFTQSTGWQGILGLAYGAIALPKGEHRPEPLFDTLVQTGLVPNGFSLQLCGPADSLFSDDVAVGGNFTVGGIDKTQYTGDLYKSKIVKEDYYQLLITDIKVGDVSLGMDCVDYNTDKTIIDSGTTNLRLPTKVFNAFVNQLRQSTVINASLDDAFWQGDAYVCKPHSMYEDTSLYDSFPSIEIDLLTQDKQTISLSVASQQYLRPVESSNHEQDCYKIGVTSSTSGAVIGAVVMEGFYTYFDRENKTILFGATTCRSRAVNATHSFVTGYYDSQYDVKTCMYVEPHSTGLPTYAVTLIAVGSLLFVLFLILVGFKLYRIYKKKHQRLRNEMDFHDLVDDTFDTSY